MDDTRQIDVPTVTIEVPTIAAVGADGPCAVVRVDPTVVTVALAVLDQYPVLLPGAPAPETADTVTHSLRAALAQAGIRPPSDRPHAAGVAPDELGRRGRDRLAARIESVMACAGPASGRVPVQCAVVAETVARLRPIAGRFGGEPLAAATRRLWEQLYLCLPLTALAARTTPGGTP